MTTRSVVWLVDLQVSYGVERVFAAANWDKRTFQKELAIEFGSPADNLFLSPFMTFRVCALTCQTPVTDPTARDT